MSSFTVAPTKPPKRFLAETDVSVVLGKLDDIMSLQLKFMEVGEHVAISRRLQLLFINFQSSFIIVFNAYHVVMYFVRLLLHHETPQINIRMALLYYGYHIMTECIQMVVTTVCFTIARTSLYGILREFNKLNIFTAEESLRCRLSQLCVTLTTQLQEYTVFGLYPLNPTLLTAMLSGTVTYIVILMQTAGDGQILSTPPHMEH